MRRRSQASYAAAHILSTIVVLDGAGVRPSRHTLAAPLLLLGSVLASSLSFGCASASKAPAGGPDLAPSLARGEIRCDLEESASVIVRETAAVSSPRKNVRRFYALQEDFATTKQTLLCRELDSNYDGIMDVVRTYDQLGEPLTERADSNYDGHVDTWIEWSEGAVARLSFDRNADGRADEKRSFVSGRLTRVEGDRNGDGRADLFEIYVEGRLERRGLDVDFDGSVDHWERALDGPHEKSPVAQETRGTSASGRGTEN